MNAKTPSIPPIPQEPQEAALWIGEWQNRLNEVALGMGTAGIGRSENTSLRLDVGRKYLRAFASECGAQAVSTRLVWPRSSANPVLWAEAAVPLGPRRLRLADGENLSIQPAGPSPT